MTKEAIKEAVVRAVNLSNFNIDFIDNNADGSLLIKVSKPNKHNYPNSIKGTIREEKDIKTFSEALI